MSTPNTDDNTKKNWTKIAREWIVSNVFEQQTGKIVDFFQRVVDETKCTLPVNSVLTGVVYPLKKKRIRMAPQKIGMSKTIHLLYVLDIQVFGEFRRRIREAGTVEFVDGYIFRFRARDGSIECKNGRVIRNGASAHTDPGAQDYAPPTPSIGRQANSTEGRVLRDRAKIRAQSEQGDDTDEESSRDHVRMSTPDTDDNSKKSWSIPAMKWIVSNVFEQQEDNRTELFQRFADEADCTATTYSVERCVINALSTARIKDALKGFGMSNTIHLLYVLGVRVEEEFRKRIKEAGKVKFGYGFILFFRANDGTLECKNGRVVRNEATDPGAQDYAPSTSSARSQDRSRIRAQPNQFDEENSEDAIAPTPKHSKASTKVADELEPDGDPRSSTPRATRPSNRGRVTRDEEPAVTDPGAQDYAPTTSSAESNQFDDMDEKSSRDATPPRPKRSRVRTPELEEFDWEFNRNETATSSTSQPRGTGPTARRERVRGPEEATVPENPQNPEEQVEHHHIHVPFIKTEYPLPVSEVKREENVHGNDVLNSYKILFYLRSLIDALDLIGLSDLQSKVILEGQRPGIEDNGMSRAQVIETIKSGLNLLKLGTQDQLGPSGGMKLKDFLALLRIQLINLQFAYDCNLIRRINKIAKTEKMIPTSQIDIFLRILYVAATAPQ